MAEHKAPDPMWTTEKVHAVIAKIYSEYEPYCERELDRMLARDVATSDLNRQRIQRENGGAVFSIRVGLIALRDFFGHQPCSCSWR